MNIRMPIGKDDFAKVRSGYYFVDKTGFLREFLKNHAEVTLFTRPRRFGKTLMMSMMRYFLDIKGAEEHRRLFDGLAIAKDAETMAEQGTRPVVFLTLRGWTALDWQTMQGVIAQGLSTFVKEHETLMDSPAVDGDDRKKLQAIKAGAASIVDLRFALALFLRVFEAYYGKKVVLLLDEYDAAVQSAWEHGYEREALDFFRAFFTTALKSSPSLDFAVMTGVLRISKENIFSALNNLKVDSVLQMKYPEAFGFTAKDVEQMARDLGREDRLPELRYWYDGYRFGGYEIYNPWSVINYFDQGCVAETYWVNTSGNAILAELMTSADREHFDALETLLKGGTVKAFLRDGVIYSDIGEDQDALYTMLCTTGYLTIEQIDRSMGDPEYTLRLPNREMLSVFSIEVVKRCQKGFGKSALVALMRAMLRGDADGVQRGLENYLEKVVSTFDTAKGKEAFYQGFVLGMTAVLVPSYDVRSNRESGYGRYDLAAFPTEKHRSGFLLEFKVAESEEKLEEEAQSALVQMEKKDYLAEFRTRGVKDVMRYGIAFCKKQVLVKMGSGIRP